MDSKKPSQFLEVHVTSASETIAVLLELRRQSFFSFRGQRDYRWDIGPHGIPESWRDKYKKEDLQETDKELKEREQAILAEMDKNEKEIYWKSKSVRRYINENLSQFLRQSELIDEKRTKFRYSEWWNNLIYAQHYKLKTLLLDWTSNPLIALYFAVENIMSGAKPGIKGAVYALKVRDYSIDDKNGKRWFEFNEVIESFPKGEFCPRWIMINPTLNSDRISRQSGKFTYHPSIIDEKLIDNVGGNVVHRFGDDEALVKVVIGDSSCDPTNDIRNELGIMNTHHGFLFPDYDGIANYINYEWREIATKSSLKKCPSLYNFNSPILDKVRKFIDDTND
jgi:hypothetical protein